MRAADINLAIAGRLYGLLRASGANAVLMRSSDTTIVEKERARQSSRYTPGMYIRIDAAGKDKQATCRIYGSLTNAAFAGMLLRGLQLVSELDSAGIFSSQNRFYYDVAMGTITVVIPSVTTGYYDGVKDHAIETIAWGLFIGILQSEGFIPDANDSYSVTDSVTGDVVVGATVNLNETISAVSDSIGTVNFFGVESGENYFRVLGNANTVVKAGEHAH